MIDLRSDTVTRPTAGMRRAMAEAEVGDDVYGEDPTVLRLQERVAALFGYEAALFTPTGSMANVLALGALVGPGQEVICESRAHILRAELGAHGSLTGLTCRTWVNDQGQIDLEAIRHDARAGHGAVLRAHDRHLGREHAQLRRRDGAAAAGPGGPARVGRPRSGAPSTSTAPASGTRTSPPGRRSSSYGAIADTMAVASPRASVRRSARPMLGSTEQVAEARVRRKRLGGGMRQVGVLAAAGIYALDHHVERMAEDHEHARLLAEACGADPALTETNIVVVDVPDAPAVSPAAREQGVLVGAVGPTRVRMLTHLDVARADVEQAAKVLAELLAIT